MRIRAFGIAILITSTFGILINIASIIFLSWRHYETKRNFVKMQRSGQKSPQTNLFHHLLTVLAIIDLIVVICCGLVYGLPDVWDDYLNTTYPYLVPYVMPITHIAVMTSVYSTILIR